MRLRQGCMCLKPRWQKLHIIDTNQPINLQYLHNKSTESHGGNLSARLRRVSSIWIKCRVNVWDAARADRVCTNKDFMSTFSFLDLSLVYRWPALLDFSFILAVTLKGAMCQNLSRATENQLNWRFVVLHLECGESNGTLYIPIFSKGSLCGVSSFVSLRLTNERWRDLKDDEISLNFWQRSPFVQPAAAAATASVHSPLLTTPNG